MRISDWSSDVCSSDLNEDEIGGGNRQIRPHGLLDRRPSRQRMGGMRQLLQADRATDRHHHAPEAQRARYPYPGQGGRYYRHPAMLIGFGELGGIDAAEHPVAPFGLGRGIAKRLGAYHPVEDRKSTRLNSSH